MSKNRRNDHGKHSGSSTNAGGEHPGNEFDDQFDSAFGTEPDEEFDLSLEDDADLAIGDHSDEELEANNVDYEPFEEDGSRMDGDDFHGEEEDDYDDSPEDLSTDHGRGELPVAASGVRSGVRSSRLRTRHRSSRQAQKAHPLVFFGGLMMLSGFALAIAAVILPSRFQAALENLNTMGLTPGLMVTLGAILALVSQLSDSVGKLTDRMNELENNSNREQDETMAANIEFLVDSTNDQPAPTAQGSAEEINQVLVTLDRQDEKINNLTKALKMYGKPLVDVSRQVAEVAARSKSTTNEIGNVSKGMQAGLESAAEKIVQDLKSLLGDAPTEMQDSFSSMGEQLTAELEELKATLQKAEEATNNDDLVGLRSDMSSLQEAVRGLATAVRTPPAPVPVAAAAPAAPAVAAAPAPAPVAAAPAPAPAPVAAAPAPPPAPAAAAGAPGPGGLASSIAGATKTEGKSVLGAIAKLKKMR